MDTARHVLFADWLGTTQPCSQACKVSCRAQHINLLQALCWSKSSSDVWVHLLCRVQPCTGQRLVDCQHAPER